MVCEKALGKNRFNILFPLREPTDNYPKCKVYNEVSLERNDHFTALYGDYKAQDPPEGSIIRLVATFHVTNRRELIYID